MRLVPFTVALLTVALPTACTVLPDDSFTGGSKDAGVLDAHADDATLDAGDASPLTDANTNPEANDARDATKDGPNPTTNPCDDPTPIVGSNVTTGLNTDGTPPTDIDSYWYVAMTTGTARCAWLWVVSAPESGSVRIGVYDHDESTNMPKNLLRHVELTNVISGQWNKVAMDALSITTGDRLWLGVAPEANDDAGDDQIEVFTRLGCKDTPPMTAGKIGPTGDPPTPFVLDATYDGQCDAAFYLGR